MSNLLWSRIQGWGVVSSEDSTIGFVNSADNAGGAAAMTIGTLTTTITTTQVGSEVYISSLPGLVDGYYTLTVCFTFGTDTIIAIKGDPANFSLTTGRTSGKIRIEDHYKICSRIPDFVQGSEARSRWYVAMVDVTPTLGSTAKMTGGIGKTDGMTISHNALYKGLDKIRWEVMNQASTVLLKNRIYDQSETTGYVATGAPWQGSYSNPNTAPALGVYEPVFLSSEGIRVDSATAAPSGPTYTFDITRGLLRTTQEQHVYGELFFDGFTTPAGKRCWLLQFGPAPTSYFDAQELFNGLITGVSYDAGGAIQQIAVADDMLVTKKRPSYGFGASEAQSIMPTDNGAATCKIDQKFVGYYWQWLAVDGVACRLSLDPLEQLTSEASTAFDNYGRVTSYQYLQRELIRDGKINAIIIERRSNVGDWERWALPADVRGVSLERGESDGRTEEEAPYYLGGLEQNSAGEYSGIPTINWTAVLDQGLDLEVCHVFEGNEFAPQPVWNVDSTGAFPSERWIRANPIEIILQILLTKWGDSQNTFTYGGETWDFDVLPAELGLSLDADQVNVEAFLRAAQFFEDNEIYVYNCHITGKDTQSLEKWLTKNILEAFLISLQLGSDGRINCTILPQPEYNTALNTLDNAALFANIDGDADVSYVYDSSLLISKITHKFDRAWMRPDDEESKKTVNYLYGIDGASRQLVGLEAEALESDLQSAPSLSDSELPALGEYFGPYLTSFRSIIPVITCQVHATFAGNAGDYIYVDLQQLPDARGTDTENLQGVGLITARKRDLLHQVDQMEVALLNTQRLDVVRGWAASGQIDTVASDTQFDLLPDEYVPPRFTDYADDASTFNVNDEVLLYDENFTLRSTDGAATISSISGNTITLSAAWKSGGLDVTPAPTDIMLHGEKQNQTTETQTEYAWLFQARNDQQAWQ